MVIKSPMFGEIAENPTVQNRIGQLVRKGAPALDDIVIATNPGAMIDGASDLGKAAKKRIGKDGKPIDDFDPRYSGVAGSDAAPAPVNRMAKHFDAVGEAAAPIQVVDKVFSTVEPVLNVAGIADMGVTMLAPALGTLATKLKAPKLGAALNAPNNYLNPEAKVKAGELTLGGKLNNAMMGTFAGIAVFGVAKSFSEKMDALKHLQSDLTGVPVAQISTMGLLMANDVPEMVKAARKHVMTEHLGRIATTGTGFALALRAIFRKKSMGMKEFLIPTFAGLGVDMLMGESVLSIYSGVKNAHGTGQPLDANAYSEFLMSASDDLKKRGAVGKRVSLALAEQYLAEDPHVSPAKMVKDIESSLKFHRKGQRGGAFDARIDAVLAQAEAEKLAHKAETKAGPEMQAVEPAKAPTMVDKIGAAGKARDVVVQGKGIHTGRLKKEMTVEPGLSMTGPS